jgi:alkaline phosphatase
MSTGVKTFNGAIAVAPDSSRLETVLERAQKRGKKTGLVSVCSITHATPAAFAAHVPSRGMQLEIAAQLAEAENDLYLGSGWGWFLPKEQGGRRTDGRNLLEAMKRRGFLYADTDSAFRLLKPAPGSRILGLFAENHVGPAQMRKPSLAEMTRFAIAYLSNSEKGFFLMVEGSQIDWAGHENQTDQILKEMADFDDAVGEAVRYAAKDPQTLIIVTADHETGGFALAGGSLKEHEVKGSFTSKEHTAAMVPLFAMGPASEKFKGIRENTIVGTILLDLLGK